MRCTEVTGYSLVDPALLGADSPRAIDDETGDGAGPGARGSDLDTGCRDTAELPEHRRAAGAEDGFRSAGEHAGHPPAVRIDAEMPDGVDARVNPDQVSLRDQPLDRGRAVAEPCQLRAAGDAVLTRRQGGQLRATWTV